jgi:hypothetical protein
MPTGRGRAGLLDIVRRTSCQTASGAGTDKSTIFLAARERVSRSGWLMRRPKYRAVQSGQRVAVLSYSRRGSLSIFCARTHLYGSRRPDVTGLTVARCCMRSGSHLRQCCQALVRVTARWRRQERTGIGVHRCRAHGIDPPRHRRVMSADCPARSAAYRHRPDRLL